MRWLLPRLGSRSGPWVRWGRSPAFTPASRGGVGSAAAFAGFYAGQMGVVKDLQGTHGIMGLAVAGAAAVIVSLVAGLLPMVTRAENPIHALLLGAVVPAILFAAGVPTFGVPPIGSAGWGAGG